MRISDESFKELCNAVERINDEIYDKREWFDRHKAPTLSIGFVPLSKKHSTLSFVCIKLSIEGGHEFTLYNSFEDDRKCNDAEDKYESWYKYIRRKWKMMRTEWSDITL